MTRPTEEPDAVLPVGPVAVARGRHRRRRRRPSKTTVVATTAAVVVLATLLVGAGWWWGRQQAAPAAAPATATSPTATSPPATSGAAVAGTRRVALHGSTVTVRESLHVEDGDVSVTLADTPVDTALVAGPVQVVRQDGTSEPLTGPVALGPGRSVLVVATYRLAACPDVLPVAWPQPLAVTPSSAAITWTASTEPLRTVRTLCPNAPPQARPLPGLTARLLSPGRGGTPATAQVRLRWAGQGHLRLARVGQVGGVAAAATGSPCPATSGCLADLAPGDATTVALIPAETCADSRPASSLLVLVRSGSKSPPALVRVPRLGSWIDRWVCG